MGRSYYRLLHCMPDGGDEIWGAFDSDEDAIKALNAYYKEKKREREQFYKDFRKRLLKKHPGYRNHPKRPPSPWWWIIQRLGYVKPNTLIRDVRLPWKTIFVCHAGDDD